MEKEARGNPAKAGEKPDGIGSVTNGTAPRLRVKRGCEFPMDGGDRCRRVFQILHFTSFRHLQAALETGTDMNSRTRLLATAIAVGLSAIALPAAADDFFFGSTNVAAFGSPTYGKVTLTQVGSDVLFNVALDPEFNFVTTGNHFVFSFNGAGVSLGDIGTITDAGTQTFSKTTIGVVNPPFGTFQFGIACATNCSNGNSAGGYLDPLTFTVAHSVINDFLVLSTGAGSLGPAYFAADVVWVADTQSFGATGAIGVTAPVPEPGTYALFLAGFGAMGFVAKRRRKAG